MSEIKREQLFDVSTEFYQHKDEAERELASLVLSNPALLALAKRKGIAPIHFEHRDYRVIWCAVDMMGDRMQAIKLFVAWLRREFPMTDRTTKPEYAIAWECGDWDDLKLWRFSANPNATEFGQRYGFPTLEHWIDRLKDFHTRLTRAQRLLQQTRDVLAGEL